MAVWPDLPHGKCSYGHFKILIFRKSDIFEKHDLFSLFSWLWFWIWSYENVPRDHGIILDFSANSVIWLVFYQSDSIFQENIVFQIVVYLQSSIMPKGSPSRVRLCRSCLRRFGDLKKNTPLEFWNTYFVDVVVFCDFELSWGTQGIQKRLRHKKWYTSQLKCKSCITISISRGVFEGRYHQEL